MDSSLRVKERRNKMFELIILAIIYGLAGYGIGRTLVQESIFEGLVEKIKSWGHYPVSGKGVSQAPDGTIIKLHEDQSIEILSTDGYKTYRPRVVALFMGKVADLLDCVFCASAQAAFQLALWTSVFTFLPVSLSVMFAAVGMTFFINDWANRDV